MIPRYGDQKAPELAVSNMKIARAIAEMAIKGNDNLVVEDVPPDAAFDGVMILRPDLDEAVVHVYLMDSGDESAWMIDMSDFTTGGNAPEPLNELTLAAAVRWLLKWKVS